MTGRIIKSLGSSYQVSLPDGTEVTAILRGKLRLADTKAKNPVVVGDKVEINQEDEWVISGIEPRVNKINRSAIGKSGQEQVLAANIDQFLVVSSLINPLPKFNFIDRCLVAAQAYRIPSVLLFTKVDLLPPELNVMITEIKRIYSGCTDGIFFSNLKKQPADENLKAIFSKKLTAVAGLSGVGKTTLINTLNPEFQLKTGVTSSKWNQGKHTTSHAELHEFEPGSYLIDTPGLREFGLTEIDAWELGHFFREMVPFLDGCRFSKCLHDNEPVCAVKDAVDSGEITRERYSSYLQMLRDLP